MLFGGKQRFIGKWELGDTSYDSVSFDFSSQDSFTFSPFIRPDGTKLYIAGDTNDTIYQYSLSTPWDASTLSYDSKSFLVSAQSTNPTGLFFNPDGDKMYVYDVVDEAVYQYTLSAAWDVSTASYASKSVSHAGNFSSGNNASIFIGKSGERLFIVSSVDDTVRQFTMSTPWDISTASYDSKSLDVSSQDTAPTDVYVRADGNILFVTGGSNDTVYQYSMSTAWDISTASYDSVSKSVTSEVQADICIYFKPDGTKMYLSDSTTTSIHQYSL